MKAFLVKPLVTPGTFQPLFILLVLDTTFGTDHARIE